MVSIRLTAANELEDKDNGSGSQQICLHCSFHGAFLVKRSAVNKTVVKRQRKYGGHVSYGEVSDIQNICIDMSVEK